MTPFLALAPRTLWTLLCGCPRTAGCEAGCSFPSFPCQKCSTSPVCSGRFLLSRVGAYSADCFLQKPLGVEMLQSPQLRETRAQLCPSLLGICHHILQPSMTQGEASQPLPSLYTQDFWLLCTFWFPLVQVIFFSSAELSAELC